MNLIQKLEQEEIARLSAGKTMPEFAPGGKKELKDMICYG